MGTSKSKNSNFIQIDKTHKLNQKPNNLKIFEENLNKKVILNTKPHKLNQKPNDFLKNEN